MRLTEPDDKLTVFSEYHNHNVVMTKAKCNSSISVGATIPVSMRSSRLPSSLPISLNCSRTIGNNSCWRFGRWRYGSEVCRAASKCADEG